MRRIRPPLFILLPRCVLYLGALAQAGGPAPAGAVAAGAAAAPQRARDLGVPFDGSPGPLNTITDVAGVLVGHTTLISGEGKLVVGAGPV